MLKFLKWVRGTFWATVFISLMILVGGTSILKHHKFPTQTELQAIDNISEEYSLVYQRAIKKSRKSAVRILSTSVRFLGGTATSTGTYFTANEKYYVITVDHGLNGPCVLLAIEYDESFYECKEYIVRDSVHDYAIIELVTPITSLEPIKIPEDLPKNYQWKKSYSILNRIVYTGYPNTIGPLTLKGDVVGYAEADYLYVFSHAYGGASGAGVFTIDGKYIGYVTAIDIGASEYGVDVLENIVLVAPAFKIDWSVVLN
jgi:hypothetical protein